MSNTKSKQVIIQEVWNFMDKFMQEAAKLPYHINLLDEIHSVDENAHSRILARLLQQKASNGRYEVFESFIKYLKEKSASFGKISIKNPDITHEKERIDLWIKDENYTIIVENKINKAPDQEEQLFRYINKAEKKYKEEQIYVIYLSPTYDEPPSEQTFGDYKERFQDRILILSYKDDILTWLSDKVVPIFGSKRKYLSSALEQYIDYLKGKFKICMDMELQEFIKREWGLNDTPQRNVVNLIAKRVEFYNLYDQIDNQIDFLKKSLEREIVKEWKSSLKKKYPDYQLGKSEVGAELFITIKNMKILIGVYIDDNQIYCHVKSENGNLPKEVKEKARTVFKNFDKDEDDNIRIMQYFEHQEYDEAFDLMLEAIQILNK